MADFPTAKTNAVDNETDVLAKHINNLENKVGIDNSTDANSLDYKVGALEDRMPTGDIVGTTDTQTLTSKTLTSPVINTGVSGTAILDEDNMASNSATKLATQQSIKAYVDSKGYTWKGEWATATAYAVNDTVEYGGSGYICIVAHTSGTFATDLTNGKWEMFVEGVSADSIASTIHGATAKTTPVDADEFGLIDSAASNVLKKLTWSNIKATLKSYFDSVTTTLTNKTLSSPLFTGTIDGWISAGETWTYASATTFTISGDKTSKYQKGDKIKLTQTSDKYFYIIGVSYSSPNTTITVTGGSDYSLANATITNNFYSRQETPFGYPAYFNTASGERVTPIGKNIKRTKVVGVSSDGSGGGFATTWTFGTAFTTLLMVSQSGTCTSSGGGQTPPKTMALIDTVSNSSCRVVVQSGDGSVISSGTYYVWAEAFGVI